MSSNTTLVDDDIYIVYVPYARDASLYPIHVPKHEHVDYLSKSIRKDPDLAPHLGDGTLRLFKCGELLEDSEDLYNEAVNWLRQHSPHWLGPNKRVRIPFPDGPTHEEEGKIDVIAVTDSILNAVSGSSVAPDPTLASRALAESAALAHLAPESLEDFLLSTTLPSRTIVSTSSDKTHRYGTVGVDVFEEESPFFAIKFAAMASSMSDDLFTRVLPAHPVVNKRMLRRAREFADEYAEEIARKPLGHEPSVWDGTHKIVSTCVVCLKAVGSQFEVDIEKRNVRANVQMDSVATRIEHGAGLAVEDKSPKVFEKHCTEENIDALCGNEVLDMQDTEYGFRAIFFKLTIYMVQEKLRWGLINCGARMRIVRIEFKEGRPYAIISEEIPTNLPAPRSVYSLICYMLLTCDSEVPVFDGIRAGLRSPPQIMRLDVTGPQTRSRKRHWMSLAPPEDVTSMVLHTTAAAGRMLVDIPMKRIDKQQTFVNNIRRADVYVVRFLGAGSFGRIFLATLVVHDLCYGHVVVKLANEDSEENLSIEARAYIKLHSLYGDGVPRYHGLFCGKRADIQYWCILIDFCGDPVKRIENLPLFQRFEIFWILLMIHHRGVMHNDFSSMNILQSKSGIRLIDFSVAIIDHECPGMGICRELIDVATKLRLTPPQMRFALLWSLWLVVYRFILRMQLVVVAALAFFAILVLLQSLRSTFSIRLV